MEETLLTDIVDEVTSSVRLKRQPTTRVRILIDLDLESPLYRQIAKSVRSGARARR